LEQLKVRVANALFISSAGADLAERTQQPGLCGMMDLETSFIAINRDGDTSTGCSACIIRRGFHAEVCPSTPTYLLNGN
jgi:hypothetical protein